MGGWGHYAIVKQHGYRLPLEHQLQDGGRYTIELRRCATKTFSSTRVSGWGPAPAVMGVGDKIIWHYMQAFAAFSAGRPTDKMRWVTYPFRATTMLQQELPDGL